MEPGSASSPVEVRPGASVSPDMVNVFEQAVTPGAAPGLRLVRLGDRPSGDAIALSIIAWVRNIAYDKDVWADLYVLGPGGVLHADSLPLDFQEPAEGGGDFFAAGAAVPAPKAGPADSALGSLQFRIYCRMSGQLFTDGILHTHQIEASPVRTPSGEELAAGATTPKPRVARGTTKAPTPRAGTARTAASKSAKAKTTGDAGDAGEEKPAAAPKPRKPRTPKA
jgi:hypothetical protein